MYLSILLEEIDEKHMYTIISHLYVNNKYIEMTSQSVFISTTQEYNVYNGWF